MRTRVPQMAPGDTTVGSTPFRRAKTARWSRLDHRLSQTILPPLSGFAARRSRKGARSQANIEQPNLFLRPAGVRPKSRRARLLDRGDGGQDPCCRWTGAGSASPDKPSPCLRAPLPNQMASRTAPMSTPPPVRVTPRRRWRVSTASGETRDRRDAPAEKSDASLRCDINSPLKDVNFAPSFNHP